MQAENNAPVRRAHALGWHFDDLRDFEFRLVVGGRLIVKKNHLAPLRLGRGPDAKVTIGPDSEYKRWERGAFAQLAAQWAGVFREPIPRHIDLNLAVVTYLPDYRSWPDLSGTYEGPQDVLQAHTGRCKPDCKRHAGAIVNDSQVRGHVGSDVRLDPASTRVELTITPLDRSLLRPTRPLPDLEF